MRTLPRFLFALAVAFAFSVFTPDALAKKKGQAPVDNALKGKITAVDKAAKTITIADKVVAVDETTIITDSGKPVKLDDLKVGVEASVSVFTLGDKLTATSIKTGTVAASSTPAKKKKK
ncbi:MAG: DUF5666 domain-containing protein [Limisphaerales bacterium]